jgi:hypothetical protein
MDHVRSEVRPARVFREPYTSAEVVECRDAEVASPSNVDRGKIERLVKQPLVQGRRDELVNLVSSAAG